MNDFFNQFNNFGVFTRTIVGNIRHGGGKLPWPLFVNSRDQGKAKRALRKAGIESWGWGYHNGRSFCQVNRDVAYQAEQALIDTGVAILGRRLSK